MGYIATADTSKIGTAIAAAYSYAYGQGTTTGDSLMLRPNSVDSYPRIVLIGNEGINVYHKTGYLYTFYSEATSYFAISYESGDNQTRLFSTQANKDIYLNPNGGKVKFGTYTAGAATDSTGYITIKDEGGTARKLMVQA